MKIWQHGLTGEKKVGRGPHIRSITTLSFMIKFSMYIDLIEDGNIFTKVNIVMCEIANKLKISLLLTVIVTHTLCIYLVYSTKSNMAPRPTPEAATAREISE